MEVRGEPEQLEERKEFGRVSDQSDQELIEERKSVHDSSSEEDYHLRAGVDY